MLILKAQFSDELEVRAAQGLALYPGADQPDLRCQGLLEPMSTYLARDGGPRHGSRGARSVPGHA